MRTIIVVLTVLVVFGFSVAAQAQATRTWVSGVGDDANPCSRTAPCKTFAGAISKTAAGGEISVLDPGGFGAVTITKAITINGDGTLAGILASLTNGVIINAGVNDRIILRNISIHGAGNGINGVRYLAGREVTLDKVNINGFTTRGVDVAVSAGGTLNMRDCTIANVPTGVRLNSTSGAIVGLFDNVDVQTLTGTAIEAAANSNGTIRGSMLTRNGTGVLANTATSNMHVEDSILSFNGTAVNASVAGAAIRLANNQILTNTVGVAFAGGAFVLSAGDNRIDNNGGTTVPNGAINLD